MTAAGRRRSKAARTAAASRTSSAKPRCPAREVGADGIGRRRSSSEPRYPLPPVTRSTTSSARATSATRSAVSSIPADKRTKPSDTSSPRQRARRSAVEWTPPKLVASAISSAAARKRLARSARAEVEGDDHPVAVHLPARHLVPGIGREAGVVHGRHVVAPGDQRRDRLGIGAAALDAQRERRQRAVGKPGLERARDGTRVAPPVAQPLRRARGRAS